MGERTASGVADAVVAIACAGSTGRTRAKTDARVRELLNDYGWIIREDERAQSRQELARAWSAWLDLMTTVKLPGSRLSLLEEVFLFEPGLRERFAAALLGGEPRG